MSEFIPIEPVGAKTGLSDLECLVFGNGVEIETKVFAKTTQESSRRTTEGKFIRILPKIIGGQKPGLDIVKVHFLPKTSLAERANDPILVDKNECNKIATDCLEGFISLASTLRKNGVDIKSHQKGEDFYLYADTTPQFAAFLRFRCGFKGSIPGNEVWIRNSEFSSDENVQKMQNHLDAFNQRADK